MKNNSNLNDLFNLFMLLIKYSKLQNCYEERSVESFQFVV